MRYLVDMRLTDAARPRSPQEGAAFIRDFILPSLEMCKKLEETGKVLAGGPASCAIRLLLVVEADSALELDELIERLPVWPLMNTDVTPLTTFEGRQLALRGIVGGAEP